jgi:hypothetical protein
MSWVMSGFFAAAAAAARRSADDCAASITSSELAVTASLPHGNSYSTKSRKRSRICVGVETLMAIEVVFGVGVLTAGRPRFQTFCALDNGHIAVRTLEDLQIRGTAEIRD